MADRCESHQQNLDRCGCTYDGCSRKGKCCECLRYHLSQQQLPGCCFPPDAEKSYDRSFQKFIEAWSSRA